MVKVISTPGPKAIYIEKLKLAVLYKLDNHEIFPRLRGLFSSYIYIRQHRWCFQAKHFIILLAVARCYVTCTIY